MTIIGQSSNSSKMDSTEDAYKQCEAGPSSHLLCNKRQTDQSCKRPFCLGIPRHVWGCCLTRDSLLESEVFTSTSDEDSTLLPEEAPMRMCKLPSRYSIPKTNKEIKRAREESVPKQQGQILHIALDWAENRSEHTKEIVPPFDQLHDKSLLQCWLT